MSFLGRRVDTPQLLKSADLYVHSSNFEGFGTAAIEAMAAGFACYCDASSRTAEVVGDVGLLFTPGHVDALVTHMNSLFNHRNQRKHFSAASRTTG
jgi:glycosyltransferase involved in cell wall biosynthesis